MDASRSKRKAAWYLMAALVSLVAWAALVLTAVWLVQAPDMGADVVPFPGGLGALVLASLFCAYRLGAWRAERGAESAPADSAAAPDTEFRSVVENCPDHIARCDGDGRLLYVNPSLATSMDVSAAEMLGRHLWEFKSLAAEDTERLRAVVARTFASGEPGWIEISLPDSDKGIRNCQFRFVAERSGDGNVVGVLGTGRDITEQRLGEKRLERERNILRTFFRALPDLAWIKDAEGRYLACNPMFEQFCGFTEAELLGRTDFAFVDFELATFFRRKDREAIEAGKPCINEEWITFASDGRRALLETLKMPIRDETGRAVGVLGIGHDITERKRMEETLRDNRMTLLEAQRIARLGSWKVDLASKRIEWSEEVFRIFELDPAKTTPSCEAYLALLEPEDREKFKRLCAESAARREPCDVQHRLVMTDGRIKHAHASWETVFADDGTPLRTVGTLQDVTAARETAQQLEESRRLLQELAAHREEAREEERRRIARDLHEELGQLLTSLRMRLSVMRVKFGQENTDVQEMIQPMLSLVDQSIDGMRHTVADLRPTPLDMGIVPALEWLSEDFREFTGIECLLSIDEGIELPDDRATGLFRIAQEALTNVARHAGADRVEIALQNADGGLRLMVKDDGRGIDLQPKRRKSFGLLGMKERSLMLGGELEIRKASDRGTEVVLRIPK